MKKVFKLIFSLAVIIALCYGFTNREYIIKKILVEDTVTSDNGGKYNIEINELSKNKTSFFYYNTLNESQKEMYCIILSGIEDYNEKMVLSVEKGSDYNNIASDVSIVMEAILADYPEIFYINPEYEVSANNVIGVGVVSLKLKYNLTENEAKLQAKQIQEKIQSIIDENISSNMSEYEKELAIHDYLATKIVYYNYENISDIPTEKHGAYEALINNSAVCDGISKAYQLILGKLGIESIIVTGKLDNEAHAWNIVNVGGEYYHVDITSDKSLMKDNNQNLVIHAYFNATTTEINQTHTINNESAIPDCTADKYNYYNMNNYTVSYMDSFSYKLKQIISAQSKQSLLEFKAVGISDVPQKLVETLYNANFNNYKTNGITKIQYTNVNDIYIVVK